MKKRYAHRPVGHAELAALLPLARREERSFFRRNPHLVRPYRRRLLAVALCQGAALQYIGRGYGVNDFDLHFFYTQNPSKPRLSRTVKRVYATVGSFRHVAVDFVRTVVPVTRRDSGVRSVSARIASFLTERPTANAQHLARKAVVALWPRRLFGKVLWPSRREILPLGPPFRS